MSVAWSDSKTFFFTIIISVIGLLNTDIDCKQNKENKKKIDEDCLSSDFNAILLYF